MRWRTRLGALGLISLLAGALLAPAPASARYLPGDEPPADDWLSVVNYYRATAYLLPVTASDLLSRGAQLHAEYMVRNDSIGHSENPTKPGYTVEGNTAAGSSNVAGGSEDATPRDMIEMWMRGPFHALGILRPGLERVGFGIAHDNSGLKTAAALDVIRGLEAPGEVDYPVSWPGNGTTQPIGTYWGGEYPNPLSKCGYESPTGVPLIVQFGRPVDVSSFSLTDDQGNGLPACEYDGSNYRNPDAAAQELGRLLLAGNNAAVVVPRGPLVPGRTYTFSVTSNGVRSESTFTVTDLEGARVSAIRVANRSCR
ncbi:MAG: CAP domain-containing protein, partial [Actinomycetota bacterium]